MTTDFDHRLLIFRGILLLRNDDEIILIWFDKIYYYTITFCTPTVDIKVENERIMWMDVIFAEHDSISFILINYGVIN